MSAPSTQTTNPRPSPEAQEKLRAAVTERLLVGMGDVRQRLTEFLKNPGRLGVVNLSLMLSESTITYEAWKDPSSNPERRARMAQAMGLPAGGDDRTLLLTLMAGVRQAFVDFRASSQGRECLRQYQEVLRACELKQVLPVVPGHDTGPMVAELDRLGIEREKDFTRSMLVDPQLIAVGLTPDEGSATQLMLAGLSVSQLGGLVAAVRRLHPRLTNSQVRSLLLRASTEPKTSIRKSLGEAEVEGLLDSTRQLLRFQVVEMFFV